MSIVQRKSRKSKTTTNAPVRGGFADTIDCKRFVLRDDAGRERLTIGTHKGRVSLSMCNSDGEEQIVMYIDNENKQAGICCASPDAEHTAELVAYGKDRTAGVHVLSGIGESSGGVRIEADNGDATMSVKHKDGREIILGGVADVDRFGVHLLDAKENRRASQFLALNGESGFESRNTESVSAVLYTSVGMGKDVAYLTLEGGKACDDAAVWASIGADGRYCGNWNAMATDETTHESSDAPSVEAASSSSYCPDVMSLEAFVVSLRPFKCVNGLMDHKIEQRQGEPAEVFERKWDAAANAWTPWESTAILGAEVHFIHMQAGGGNCCGWYVGTKAKIDELKCIERQLGVLMDTATSLDVKACRIIDPLRGDK